MPVRKDQKRTVLNLKNSRKGNRQRPENET